MKKFLIYIFLSLFTIIGFAQTENNENGMFSLGVRHTISYFNYPGKGVGGQFRIRLADKINTEWYADYITSEIDYAVASRTDYHIGWSVLYYPFNNSATNALQPFFEAGHCFDYSTFTNTLYTYKGLSSAVQMGIGTHFNMTKKFDASLKAQYMLHLGKNREDVFHSHSLNEIGYKSTSNGLGIEEHLLITLSLNYKIGKLW